MGEPSAGIVRWQLQYSSVTDAEWATIEQLFEAAEGRLTTFTFLDPTARDTTSQTSPGQRFNSRSTGTSRVPTTANAPTPLMPMATV